MIGLASTFVLATLGQPPTGQPEAAPAPVRPIAIVTPLRPAKEPRPSLRYRLTVEPTPARHANAAPILDRALLIYEEQLGQLRTDGSGARTADPAMQMSQWLDGPLADLPRDSVRRVLDALGRVRHEVALAVACDHADWQFDRPDNGIAFLMPEIQGARHLGRLLALEARLALAEGRLDDAWTAIQTGLNLARLVADGPNLIQALVGVAITNQMTDALRELTTLPSAPCLFWALAERPRPWISLRAGLESERRLLDVEVPDLRDLDRGVWSVDQARRSVAALDRLVQSNAPGEPGRIGLQPLAVALDATRIYPAGRQALLAEGRPLAEVDAMPVLQVALWATYRDYLAQRDAMFRWAHVPFAQSVGKLDGLLRTAQATEAHPLLAAMVLLHAEGLESARWVGTRAERALDALQVVEAIRLHATQHDGRLPESLARITDLPLPLDPATGQPFAYRVEGTTAILSGPPPTGVPDKLANARLTFEIRLTTPPVPAPTPVR